MLPYMAYMDPMGIQMDDVVYTPRKAPYHLLHPQWRHETESTWSWVEKNPKIFPDVGCYIMLHPMKIMNLITIWLWLT